MTLHQKALSLPCPHCQAKAGRGCEHTKLPRGRILTAGVRTRRRVHVARYITARVHQELEAST